MQTYEDLMKEVEALKATLKAQEESIQKKDSILAENETLLAKKDERIQQLEMIEKWYLEQIKKGQRDRFGKSSEKSDSNQISLADLFDEAELLRQPIMTEPTEDIIDKPKKSNKKKRGESYKNLPVEVIEYKLEDTDLDCGVCGDKLHVMSKEVRKELVVIPARVLVKEHVSYIYSCRNCENTGEQGNVVKADAPKALIPKSLVSPSVLAYTMNQKYVMATPLYRQEQEWKRQGVNLTRQNLSNWIIKGANLLKPLEDALKNELNSQNILHADETTLEVIRELGRKADQKSYMWLYSSANSVDKQVVLYDYQTGRSGDFAKKYLSNWEGKYLCCDGYGGYKKLEDVSLCGCYAHLRRYFNDAYESAKCDSTKKCLDYLGMLFACEKYADQQKYDVPQRLAMRQEKYPAILEEFYAYIAELSMKTLPKSLLGKAIHYAQNQKTNFYTMLEDGNIELTNNRAERLIKMFVIGRKNFLFSNTPGGATASARIYSIVQTAIANGLKPMDYLQFVFEKIQENPDVDPKALLPWSENVPESCKNILNK